MKLYMSYGTQHPARIVRAGEYEWDEIARELLTPVTSDDKTSAGWYCPAKFEPEYRHSDNFVARYALTLDYDQITVEDIDKLQVAFLSNLYVVYTTASHAPEKPRLRVFMPLSRPADELEFGAVSRRVAQWAGIELASRESHAHAQMMYRPTVKPGATFRGKVHEGQILDVDAVLKTYASFADRRSWPRRSLGDDAGTGEAGVPPEEKPGIIGAFNRAYSVEEAIEQFDLPYRRVR